MLTVLMGGDDCEVGSTSSLVRSPSSLKESGWLLTPCSRRGIGDEHAIVDAVVCLRRWRMASSLSLTVVVCPRCASWRDAD